MRSMTTMTETTAATAITKNVKCSINTIPAPQQRRQQKALQRQHLQQQAAPTKYVDNDVDGDNNYASCLPEMAASAGRARAPTKGREEAEGPAARSQTM